MKFIRYINESKGNTSFEEIIQLLNEKCTPFLKDIVKKGKDMPVIYSGRNDTRDWFIKPVRKDRIPKDTPLHIHDKLDDAFNRKFGFKARSNALFVTGRKGTATGYGKAYMIFPIGKFKYLYNDDIKDLWLTIDRERENTDFYGLLLDKHGDSIKRDGIVEWENEYGEGQNGGEWVIYHNYERLTFDGGQTNDDAFEELEEFFKDRYPDGWEELIEEYSSSDFSWNPNIDLDDFLDDYVRETIENMDSDFYIEIEEEITEEWIDNNIHLYSTKNLQNAIDEEVEIMLNCKEYLAIAADTYESPVVKWFKDNGLKEIEKVKIENWYLKNKGRIPRQLKLFKDEPKGRR